MDGWMDGWMGLYKLLLVGLERIDDRDFCVG